MSNAMLLLLELEIGHVGTRGGHYTCSFSTLDVDWLDIFAKKHLISGYSLSEQDLFGA